MRAVTAAFADWFKHPVLAAVLISGAVLFLIAGGLDVVTPFTIPVVSRQVPRFAAAFFGMFAILTSAIGVLAYGILFVAKAVSLLRDRMGPAAA